MVGSKPEMYSFLVDNNEHKKTKGANKYVVATIGHNAYNEVLLKIKCIRHSMNRIQSKNHKIGIYEINKIWFSGFDDKYICKSMDMMD